MPLVLVVALLVVPIVEIYVLVQVGQVIGAWPTVLLLLLESALCAWLIRREGRRAWRALRQSAQATILPTKELLDGALVLIGGTLLLTPGFVTDIVGFALVLPVSRPFFRRALTYVLARRMGGMGLLVPLIGGMSRRRPRTVDGSLVEGSVVNDSAHTSGPGPDDSNAGEPPTTPRRP